MAYSASPTSGTQADAAVTLSVEVTDQPVITSCTIFYRINGGSWVYSTKNQSPASSITHSVNLWITGGGDYVQWAYIVRFSADPPVYKPSSSTYYSFSTVIDSANPTINSATPADAATIYPDANQKCDDFTCSVTDAFGIDYVELWIDGSEEDQVTYFWSTVSHDIEFDEIELNKGTYDWYIKAYDVAGHVTQMATRSVTVGNVVPTAPGTPVVGGGLTTVAYNVAQTVTWTASTDNNPDDTITYILKVKYGAGAWGNVATGIAGLSQAWTPSTAGTAYLKVVANDGTGDSSDSGTWTGTVEESDPPNAPTLTAPNGPESWSEGSTQNITYTKASPEHPDSLACTYEFEFSADGSFTDAVAITSGVTATTYAWTLPTTLVASDTATCKVRVRARDSNGATSAWDASNAAFDVIQNSVPTVTLVTPTDEGLLQKADTTTFVFLCDDAEDDGIHLELQVSEYSDFRSTIVDTDTTTDYANWEEAADPFTTWTTMTSAGCTHDYEARFAANSSVFRYDTYYGRVRVSDAYLTSDWSTFSFTVTGDPTVALAVTIDGAAYGVISLVITENTGGEPSPITLSVPLSVWLADDVAPGDTVAISSGLGGHNRTWNATVETWTLQGDTVGIYCLQDDAYLSRKLVTGDEASADLGANLADFVDDYGAPLDEDNIDTTVGVTMALTGGYKTLREHFNDALKAAPNYILWVDTGGSVWFVDQDDLSGATYELYEEDPTA